MFNKDKNGPSSPTPHVRVRDNSISESPRNGGNIPSLGDIPEDEKVRDYSIGVHNHDNFPKSKRNNNARRNSYSMQREDFDTEEEHRRYKARKRWRKVKIFMKA